MNISNGAAILVDNTIQTSGRHGIQVGRSTLRLGGPNLIETSAEHGIAVFQGTVFQGVGDVPLPAAGLLVQDNARSGILLANASSAEFQQLNTCSGF